MQRFYCPLQDITGNKIILSEKSQVHHLKDVLRLKIDDEVIVFDDKNNEYTAVIEELSAKAVMFKIKTRHKLIYNQKAKITVACAIPKKSKMDDIVDKLTQLGVDRIIPLETERVIVRLDNNKKPMRQKRWEKIIISSSQQSQRITMPTLEQIQDIKEVLLHSNNYDLKIIPTLSAERRTLKEIFAKSKPKNILVLIGPEGDFTPDEVNLAKKAGFIPISLGNFVLRVETAAVAVASFIRLYENN